MPNRDPLKVGVVAVTSPAVATDFSYTATEDMIIRSGQIKLQTDGTGANRTVQLTFEDSGANVYFRAGTNGNLTASLVHYIVPGRYMLAPNSSVENQAWRVLLPADGVFLPKGGKIKSVSSNLQAGDQFSAITFMAEKP